MRPTDLFDLSLESGAVPIGLWLIGALVLVGLLIRRPLLRWIPSVVGAAVVGGALGFLIAWWLGDVEDAFGVTLTFATRAWFALGTAGVAVGLVSLWRARRWRIPLGIAAILVSALIGGVGINSTIGEFPTVASLIAPDSTHDLHRPAPTHAATTGTALWQTWRPTADLRTTGETGLAHIPDTYSHFVTTDAIVYLPPAALVRNPPKLPLMMFLGGQPGSPQTVIDSGQLPELLNAFAADHRGLAPIVVIPNQLDQPQDNPMCLDSPLGNVQTYLTEDVPDWIRTHLNVLTARKYWTVAGFSEGGTCSILLGTRFHSMFGSILDISGQVAPLNGDTQQTIDRAFHGDAAAYAAASPLALLKANAPMGKTVGVFVVGADDAKYRPETDVVETAAIAAGMTVHEYVSSGTAHDWFTVQYGVRVGLPILARVWGIER